MADRVTHGHFETFARARLEFVRNIASLSERPEYLEVRVPAPPAAAAAAAAASRVRRPPRGRDVR